MVKRGGTMEAEDRVIKLDNFGNFGGASSYGLEVIRASMEEQDERSFNLGKREGRKEVVECLKVLETQKKEWAEANDFAKRIAKAMNEIKSSHVFFILQQAYPEYANEWEWEDFQVLLDKIARGAVKETDTGVEHHFR